MITAEHILSFWFANATIDPSRARERYDFWFKASPEIDATIRERFTDLYTRARAGNLQSWQASPRSCLALIIVLDQFPRNLYRATPAAFATDPQAQTIVQHGLAQSYQSALDWIEQAFFLMPLQHAEQLSLQEESVRRCQELLSQAPAEWQAIVDSFQRSAEKHLSIIQQFGRFPHRNSILGRASTPEERAFLDAGSGSFGQAPIPGSG